MDCPGGCGESRESNGTMVVVLRCCYARDAGYVGRGG